MAKAKPGKKDYTIKGTNIVVRVGDCVLMQQPKVVEFPYVAKVVNIESGDRNNVQVCVRWYYRPEDTSQGRKSFYGEKELLLSNHHDTESADTINGKCIVHTLEKFVDLGEIDEEDYFCRFKYNAATEKVSPARVHVYCKCMMPWNPDDLMVQCEACEDWFHPSCVGITVEQAKRFERYLCSGCSSGGDALKQGFTTGILKGESFFWPHPCTTLFSYSYLLFMLSYHAWLFTFIACVDVYFQYLYLCYSIVRNKQEIRILIRGSNEVTRGVCGNA